MYTHQANTHAIQSDYKEGDLVQCYVLDVDNASKHIDLSLRPSRIHKLDVPDSVRCLVLVFICNTNGIFYVVQ